jgi:hypothetical protein
MRQTHFIFCLLLFTSAGAQDLNGIWRGKLLQDPGGCYSQYNIELQINFIPTANSLSGKSYDYYDISKYVKLDFTGRFNAVTKRMVIIENNLLESFIPGNCIPCIKTYDLVWTKKGTEEVLTGECKAKFLGIDASCPGYKVELKRTSKSDFAVDVEQSPELKAIQLNLKLKPREKELVQVIKLENPSIKIELYDNAEIDNDTITVLLNNKLLLYRRMLTDKPLTITLNAFPNTDYELVMYADNLGSIPPNTALMVVTAGTKKYEVHLSSSEQKSASVKFRYDRKE